MPRDTTAIDPIANRDFADGDFAIPSKAELAQARKARETNQRDVLSTPHGTVVGLDLSKYQPALIDLTLPPPRIAYYRKRYADKGYARVDGKPLVVGYDGGCEVWIKTQSDYRAAREDKVRRIEREVARGRMHSSALGGTVHVRNPPRPTAT